MQSNLESLRENLAKLGKNITTLKNLAEVIKNLAIYFSPNSQKILQEVSCKLRNQKNTASDRENLVSSQKKLARLSRKLLARENWQCLKTLSRLRKTSQVPEHGRKPRKALITLVRPKSIETCRK